MKRERSGISLLLGFLLALSMLISAVHSSKAQSTTSGFATLSPQEGYEILMPFIQSESVASITKTLQGSPADSIRNVLDLMVSNKTVSHKLLLEIIASCIDSYDEGSQHKILDVLLNPVFLDSKGTPWLVVAANSQSPKSIKAFIAWAKKRREQYPQLRRMVGAAFDYALERNDSKSLELLRQYGTSLSKKRATLMLWKAVATNRKPEVVQFFIKQGADVNQIQGGATPLIKAAKNLNIGVVKVLVEGKADVNKSADLNVGSPLQVVQEAQRKPGERSQQALAIEEFLRSHGATD